MKIHIVQKGDTLWEIAKMYGVDFEELKNMNSHLSSPDMIMPGMKIKIPSTSKPVKKGQMHIDKSKEHMQHKKPIGTIKEDDKHKTKQIKAEMPVQPFPMKQMPLPELEMPLPEVSPYPKPKKEVPKEIPKQEKPKKEMPKKELPKKEIPKKQKHEKPVTQKPVPLPLPMPEQMPMPMPYQPQFQPMPIVQNCFCPCIPRPCCHPCHHHMMHKPIHKDCGCGCGCGSSPQFHEMMPFNDFGFGSMPGQMQIPEQMGMYDQMGYHQMQMPPMPAQMEFQQQMAMPGQMAEQFTMHRQDEIQEQEEVPEEKATEEQRQMPEDSVTPEQKELPEQSEMPQMTEETSQSEVSRTEEREQKDQALFNPIMDMPIQPMPYIPMHQEGFGMPYAYPMNDYMRDPNENMTQNFNPYVQGDPRPSHPSTTQPETYPPQMTNFYPVPPHHPSFLDQGINENDDASEE